MRPDIRAAIRTRLIAAMEQRAASLDGEVRRALDARLAELRALDADAPDDMLAADAMPPRSSSLRELVDQLARDTSGERTTYPDVPALADFRQLWSGLRTDSQLRQSVAHSPTDAGPLNSTALASRAIALMREVSPAYLRSFLAYVDDLAWLEPVGVTGAATAPGVTARKKRIGRKPKP
ncbi:DUF2894 domain-containing protein [Frateuria hangzhouensis]|uniref:DUF2894 domain-containing protein n=1 Tax=Frateuria hangzhouensis TaxID=2995589 RepID=UPI00226081A1|nr:DUF2894 domain-containing protein [Frateuria sp. STR12]MCX7515165.1 DUF2894 domain-containing protein [Frateuria sp. STR12]